MTGRNSFSAIMWPNPLLGRFREFRPAKARLAAFQRSESKDAWPGQSIREACISRRLQ